MKSGRKSPIYRKPLHEAVDLVLREDVFVVFVEGFLGFGSDEEG